MEAPLPRPLGLELKKDPVATRTLKRKASTLQTSVEVLKCRFGKPVAVSQGDKSFLPSKEWTPIYYAVHHQREAALTHFLQSGGSPDDVTGTGHPPLCIAVANGNINIVRSLLEAGANVDAKTRDSGETALHLAIKNGRGDIVELIVAAGPKLDVHTDETGETPLHFAAAKPGSLATIVTLLRMGAKYDTLNTCGQTPAEVALDSNNLHGAVAIINAAHGKRNKLVKEKEMLLKHVQKTQGRFSIGNDLIADIFAAACDPDSTVLVEAIKRDDYSLVEMFLEKGSDPDRQTARGDIPIFVAIACAGPSVIQALVKHNADVLIRYKGLTVLQAAFEGPFAQDEIAMSAIFDALLRKGADPLVTCPDGKTLLHLAVSSEFGHTRVAYLLIGAGVKVNAQDFEGNTALHFATHNKLCIDLLLKNGANPQHANVNRLTPLLFATTHNDKAREPDLESLIKVSDLRKTTSNARAALHMAALNGLERTIRLLLRARAETTIVDSCKNTPLLLAVKHQQWSVVPILTIPPSVNSWDEDGMSALHHIARSSPSSSSTWLEIAAAAAPFCERGVSRSMRDRSGATPLIQAVKTLPEEGLPVIETLLVRTPDRRASWNCASHEDHMKCDALHYAISLKKIVFVEALLKNGAVFSLTDWTKRSLNAKAPHDKQILKMLAQYEWTRRAGSLRRQPGAPDAEFIAFNSVFSVKDVRQMLSMGLQVNALPRSSLGTSMLWAVLRQIPLEPSMSPSYQFDILELVLDAGADPNESTARDSRHSQSPVDSKESSPLLVQPLIFLLEEYPSVDINLITILLSKGAKLSTASLFYGGRLPLHSAAKANRIDIVDEFLLQCADINSEDKTRRTPLFIAAEQGSWEVTDVLLRRGAKVDIVDTDHNTPLHAAAMGGNKRVVAALLRAGAKCNVENAMNMTPLACVSEELEEKERERIVRMLKVSMSQETRQAELQKQQSEQNAAHEGRILQRKVEDAGDDNDDTQLHKRQKEERLQIQQDRNTQHQRKAQEQEKTQTRTRTHKLRKPTQSSACPPPPPPTEKPHSSPSLFKTPSLFFSRPKNKTSPSTTKPTKQSQHQQQQQQPSSIISIRINTPPFPPPPPPPPPTLKPIPIATNPPPTTPRTDSTAGLTASLALNREQGTRDGDADAVVEGMGRRESGRELSDWLAISRAMERL
ncbi:hypothetical protein J1614_009710 [Plenodomus biglobosus]|nr:hypothetical protein J1614_009710 [Plenodomus biglobosus]